MQITFPKIAKYLALLVFLSSSIYLVTFLVRRGATKPPAPMQSPKTLNDNLTMVSNNFRYVQAKSGVNKLILTAEREVAFIDERHTLEGVKLETFDDDGKPSGVLTAGACDYNQKTNTAQFKGAVVVTTATGLTVKTERLDYDQGAELAVTDLPVAFSRENVSGTCVGMKLDGKASRLVMERAVNVTVAPTPSAPGTAAKARIGGGDRPYAITGAHGEYLKAEKRVVLIGDARLVRGGEEMKADRITGFLDDKQSLQRLEARSNALLKSDDKSGQITSRDMDIFFDQQGDVTQAVAIGDGALRTTGSGPGREVFGDRIEARFIKGAAGSEIAEVKVLGDARMKLLAAPPTPQSPQPAERDLTAKTLTVNFYPGGKFAQSATAEGDAVLTVTPVVVEPRADRKLLRAPRLDAAFYETDNQFKTCTAQGGVRLEMTPLEANAKRAPKTTTSATARADFDRASSDASEIVQEGNVTFNEGARNGTADRATYVRAQETVRLRGTKRPLLYDDKARIEAREIDVSTASAEHFARGDVRVTYYNPENAGSDGVFRKSKSPVFVTSDEARGDGAAGRAVYTGEARCWQDDNFVRGDRIEMFQKERRLTASGKVSTALYHIERSVSAGQKQVVPVFGSSDDFSYSDAQRQARYHGNVKLTQGDESLTAETTEIFLDGKSNRVERMTASKKVVLVQPNRRGTGDSAEYTAATDRYVLTGNMARIEDAERGDSTGPQLIFTKSNDTVRAVDQNRSRRIRSTHKVQQ
jgi:lipopolysaccharide export system protein LptA